MRINKRKTKHQLLVRPNPTQLIPGFFCVGDIRASTHRKEMFLAHPLSSYLSRIVVVVVIEKKKRENQETKH